MTDNTEFVLDDEPFDHDYVDYEEAEPDPLPVRGPDEPLLVALLRESLGKHHTNDAAITDFVEIVLPQLIPLLTAIPAKGGDFAAEKAEQGADTANYVYDQSLRAHIVNGLFASVRILDLAAVAGNDTAQHMGDYGRRLLMATYMLHDYNKMPEVKVQMGTGLINPSAANIDQIYRMVGEQADRLRLPDFFTAGGHLLKLSDLIHAVHNTQVLHGTIPPHLLKDRLSDPRLVNAVANFSRIADLLAYGTFLELDTLVKINTILRETLTDPPFLLTAHRITQVTGIVTAYLHNAVVGEMLQAGHEPILFASNGVIYASPHDAVIPDLDVIAQAAADQIQNAATQGIERLADTTPVGIAWGTQGLKTAPFIEALHTPDRVLSLVWRQAGRKLRQDSKSWRKREQLKVFKKLESGQKYGWSGFESDQVASLAKHMDERAEALADWLAYAYTLDVKNETNVTDLILTALGFDIDRERLLIDTAQSGGVQFWPYLLALRFIADHSDLRPDGLSTGVNDLINGLLAERFGGDQPNLLIEHVRQHALEVILLPGQPHTVRERFLAEIAAYAVTKTDNKHGGYDTIYNIPHGVEQQQEATLPYMPTPYSQRLPLGSSDGLGAWRRGLSGVGVVNMLLMQTALRTPFQFEDRKGKMLFLYPVYYFTPETGDALLGLTQRLYQFDLIGWLKHTQFGLKVDAETVSRYQAVTERPDSYRPPVEAMRYPAHLAPTLVQVAVDPGKDATECVSWINAIFMALILATIADVKIVVSDSPVPLYASGVSFTQTIVLDAPHAAFSDLIGREINIDHLIGSLQRLTVAIAVTRDAYGFDKPDQLAKIARDLSEESAQVFRGYQRIGEERAKKDLSVSTADARRYLAYTRILDATHPVKKRSAIMNHAYELVERYCKFYRAKGYKSNAILRPLQAAADIVVDSSSANSDPDMLLNAIAGRLIQIDNAIMNHDTEGFPPPNSTIPQRQIAIREFARYFVQDYFIGALKGRKADLRGRQFNILRLACDAVYRDLNARSTYQPTDQAPESDATPEVTQSEK